MPWLSRTRNKIVLAASIGLFFVAGFLVVFGILTHREAGLLTVCWDEEGQAEYLDGTEGRTTTQTKSCPGSTELAWPPDQIPITVSSIATQEEIAVLAENDPRQRVLGQAIRDINSQVGFSLFRLFPAGTEEVSVWVHFGESLTARRHGEAEVTAPPGYVFHRQTGDNLEGHVHIRSDVESDDRLLYLVIEHELLHIAGLAHDFFLASIMFPITRDETLDNRIMTTAHITDHDVALLRRLYAGE